MVLSTHLTEQLLLLASGTVRDGSLVDGLACLASTLRDAVPDYCGLQLTIVHSGHPVRLTALVEPASQRQVGASLRLHLPMASTAFEEGGRLVVWSTVPGSLVDLAADLCHVLKDPASVQLDVDLPPPAAASGLEGVEELATIHRAAGFLVERGQDVDSVHETMRARASREGLSTYGWAQRLLGLG